MARTGRLVSSLPTALIGAGDRLLMFAPRGPAQAGLLALAAAMRASRFLSSPRRCEFMAPKRVGRRPRRLPSNSAFPQKLLKEGVRDMVRISDARMSGTSCGACVLHVTPESHVGGPLALVRDGDLIALDIEARSIDMLVEPAELARRQAAWTAPAPKFNRGYGVLYLKHVQQADTGCDFDFLAPDPAVAVGGEPEIH
jgi:hypothetical protein